MQLGISARGGGGRSSEADRQHTGDACGGPQGRGRDSHWQQGVEQATQVVRLALDADLDLLAQGREGEGHGALDSGREAAGLGFRLEGGNGLRTRPRG